MPSRDPELRRRANPAALRCVPCQQAREAAMTGQTNEAAERSAHVLRGEGEAPAKLPVVRLPDGSWKLRVLMEAEARIEELKAERDALLVKLAAARREALEEAAVRIEYLLAEDSTPPEEFAAAIRALAVEGRGDV